MKHKKFPFSPHMWITIIVFTTGCSGPVDETASLMSAQTDVDSLQTMAISSEEPLTGLRQIAYIKASNTGSGDNFGAGGILSGDAVVLSKDGSTLAVSAPFESSASSGIGGDQADESMYGAGAVYIFVHRNNNWVQQAYVKASNPGLTDNFGFATAMSADGNTLAVSAHFESSGDAGIEADQNDNSIPQAGAVYVFTRTGDV